MKALYLLFLGTLVYNVIGLGIDPPARFSNIVATYAQSVNQFTVNGQCTKDNIAIRRSWESLSSCEREEYIAAVKCLHKKPSIADPHTSPGNRNRMDDFTYSHIVQSNHIHLSGNFLPWHRQFLWAWEKALREECNYTGFQPYMEWPRWAAGSMGDSPLFDGSATSLGGNGRFIAGRGDLTTSLPGIDPPFIFQTPSGSGGGCVEDGPLVPFDLHLGPVTPLTAGTPGSGRDPNDTYGLQFNPRCLTRDFGDFYLHDLNWENITSLLESPTISIFGPALENEGNAHANLHGSVGGEGFDFYSSPGDPGFYFMHAFIDYLWSLWQGQDFSNRKNGLSGTKTLANRPPSAEITLDDILELTYAGGQVKVSDTMSTFEGPYCYRYE